MVGWGENCLEIIMIQVGKLISISLQGTTMSGGSVHGRGAGLGMCSVSRNWWMAGLEIAQMPWQAGKTINKKLIEAPFLGAEHQDLF